MLKKEVLSMKKYTHSKGFNVTSLEGVTGVYMFREECGDIVYVGSCRGDFKNRLNSHYYHPSQKLTDDVRYMYVLIVEPHMDSVLHVLEHLLIWYFNPSKNDALWFFGGSEEDVKRIAKENNLHIRGSIEEFLLSFECVLIEREWDDNFEYKRYGEQEQIDSKKVRCTGTLDCLCFRCLVKANSTG
jgi:hypothetical protein